MKADKTFIGQVIMIAIMMVVICCTGKDDLNGRLWMSTEGPFREQRILTEFALDSLHFNIKSQDLFIATIYNKSENDFMVNATKEKQIFADSAYYHSYRPYSAQSRSWNKIVHQRPKSGIELDRISGRQSGKYWFVSYYDEYVDTMFIYFNMEQDNSNIQFTVTKLFPVKDQSKIDFALIENEVSKFNDKVTRIEIRIDGPMTYQEANQILNYQISYNLDKEEVFVVEIINRLDERLYIETWPSNEINFDTIYSYTRFFPTSQEKLWVEYTNNKVASPTDTVELKPNEGGKFWIRYSEMTPSIDTLLFIKGYNSDSYYIDTRKLYEVNHLHSYTG